MLFSYSGHGCGTPARVAAGAEKGMLINTRTPVLLAVVVLALLSAVVLAEVPATPEQSSVSLGDLARQLRAAGVKKADKVINNEDLSPVDFRNGAVITEAAPDQPAKAESSAKGKPDKSVDPKERDEEFHRKYLERKKALGLMERDLSVTKRELNLQTTEFYADGSTNLNDRKAWSEKRKQYEDDIAEKQKQVDEAKHALENLKEEGRKAGASAGAFED
jgi:hypothetical protein